MSFSDVESSAILSPDADSPSFSVISAYNSSEGWLPFSARTLSPLAYFASPCLPRLVAGSFFSKPSFHSLIPLCVEAAVNLLIDLNFFQHFISEVLFDFFFSFACGLLYLSVWLIYTFYSYSVFCIIILVFEVFEGVDLWVFVSGGSRLWKLFWDLLKFWLGPHI